MGSAASLTSDEKVQLSQTIADKYEHLKNDVATETELFDALKETYNQVNSQLLEKRKSSSVDPVDFNVSSAVPMNAKLYEFGNSVRNDASQPAKEGADDELLDLPTFSSPPGKLLRQKTSSQLLAEATDSVLEDQEKIANFISQLKSGEVQTQASSEFRARRLTYHQKTAEGGTLDNAKATVSLTTVPRTSIYSSTEIGVQHETDPPFPPDILGTFSCHGIEPSYEEESGIHEKINQDRGCIAYPYNSKKNEALFVVLDGHGEQGDKVSEFVMRQIVVSLEKDPKLNTDPAAALKNTFVMTNTALMVTQIKYMTSGCTCVAVYVKENKLYVSNVGDSRAVMAYKNEKGVTTARDLSRDHKPDDPEEQARIEKWGGYVCPAPEPGLSARVYLDPDFTMIGLAMSRSLGDHAVKAIGVIPEPEITIFDLNQSDKYMIMASDGVWEFISSQEAVDIVDRNIDHGVEKACQVLIERAAQRWQEEEGDYRDDITAIIVKFPLPYMT
eukprot:gene11038-14822_t